MSYFEGNQSRRGPNGEKLFMERIECTYSIIDYKILGLVARQNMSSKVCQQQRCNAIVICLLESIVSKLTSSEISIF